MTFSHDASFEGETRIGQLSRPSEDSQRISAQVGSSMDQFNAIRNVGKKSVELPELELFEKKALNEKQTLNEKQITQDKKEYLLKNPPDKNDGYILNPSLQKIEDKTNAHNKQVFSEVDINHNGKLSLKELESALSAPKSDLTKTDREQLQSQEYQILKKLAIAGEHKTHKFDPDLRQYLEQNPPKY
jgi:Fe-S cluster biosynthesis and repair protein YggX